MLSLLTTILITGLASFAAGWLLHARFGEPSEKEKKLQQDLTETKLELTNYQTEVNQYLEKTADLFNNVSINYKKLYEHLSSGSAQLSHIEAKVAPLEQLTKVFDTSRADPDHNWHPTYFEARDAIHDENNEIESKKLDKLEKINNNDKSQLKVAEEDLTVA